MRKPFWPRAINHFLFAAALLAGFVVPASAKDTAPGWLHELATATLPPHDDEDVAVVLLDNTEMNISADGSSQTLHRQAVKILRPEARDRFGELGVEFDQMTKISYMKGWTITPDGRDLALGDKDCVDHGYLESIEYIDAKVRVLKLPEVRPGSVVGFEWVTQDKPNVFEETWLFQDRVPVKQARFSLHLPAAWSYSATFFNHPQETSEPHGEFDYSWQLNDVPPVRTEPQMPPFRSVAGWMGLKYFPRDASLRSKSSGTWADVSRWYNDLEQPQLASNPAIHAKVTELTAAATDPLAKIRALTEYMQRNIRYFAIEVGIGGWQPHTASDVFQHQYGDCKDKVTLLSAMLKEIGVQSYFLSVDDFREGIHPEFPSPYLNHSIIAIRLPEGVDSSGLHSVVDDPKLGKLLIFDPTNEYVPLGDIPWYEQNTYALVDGSDGGALISLPVAPPSVNRSYRAGKFSLETNGVLSGEVQEVNWGSQAALLRQQYIDTEPAKRSEILERSLQRSLSIFQVLGATVGNLDQNNLSLVLNYKFVAPGYVRSAGNEWLLRPEVLGEGSTRLLNLFAEQRPRQYGIELTAASRQDDVFDITLPNGMVLDGASEPVTFSCEFATYSSKAELNGNVLHYVRTLQIQKVHVPKESVGELKDFLQKVAADQAMYISLKSAGS